MTATLSRLNKVVSEQHNCSRRQADDFIIKGWVLINGKPVTEPGIKLCPTTTHIDLTAAAQEVLHNQCSIMYYKPRGIVTHSPEQSQQAIADIIESRYRQLSPIGRLDRDSEGLILLTSDGLFAKRCLTPATPFPRRYLIQVSKPLTPEMIRKCEAGVTLFGKPSKPCTLTPLGNNRYSVCLTEGKNRHIRRMIQKVGSMVVALKRTHFGPITLGSLQPNQCREIKPF